MAGTPPNPERILDGGPIVAAAKKAGASYIEQAFASLERQLGTVIKGNVPDPEMNQQVEELTRTILKQLQQRLGSVFSDTAASEAGGGDAGASGRARRKPGKKG